MINPFDGEAEKGSGGQHGEDYCETEDKLDNAASNDRLGLRLRRRMIRREIDYGGR